MPMSIGVRLEEAFARAARVEGAAEAARSKPDVRRAWRILDARRKSVAAEACPRPVRRRIEGWFGGCSDGVSFRWLSPVFDSRREALPISRGTGKTSPRTLRYVGGGAIVDLQVQTSPTLGTVLHVAVNPAHPGATVEVRMPHRGSPQRAVLGGDGTADLTIPGKTRKLAITVRLLTSEPVRIPTLHLQ